MEKFIERISKFIKRIGVETAFAGAFGSIAIIAVIVEMAIAGFDPAAIAGGVKDIAGTIVTVVMLIITIRKLSPKKKRKGDFEKIFRSQMNDIISKYQPLIRMNDNKKNNADQDDLKQEIKKKGNEKTIRYYIADNVDVLYKNTNASFIKLFDLVCKDKKWKLSFVVNKTLFVKGQGSDFPKQHEIVTSIATKITGKYNDFLNERYDNPSDNCFELTFKEEPSTAYDAEKMVEIIDHIILYYIAACKKEA